MAAFMVNRSIQFLLGIPRRSLLTSRAKIGYKFALPVRYDARRWSKTGKTQNIMLLDRYAKKESSLFRSGASNGGKEEACSSKSGACRFPVQSSGDGSMYEISSFSTKPKCDVVFNDVGEPLEFEDSTVSEMHPTECELIEESVQLFDKPEAVSENTLTKRDKTDLNKLKQGAERLAIESLVTRSFTTVELGKKLRGKKYPPRVIEMVIVELKSRGLLNDGLYAESFSQSRWFSSSWGPRRIKRALLQKGVSEKDIDEATNLIFKDGDMTIGDTYLGMSKISMDRLFAQASKQWLRVQNTSLANRRSRMMRWLQYRGFDWRITNFILKKLEAKCPP